MWLGYNELWVYSCARLVRGVRRSGEPPCASMLVHSGRLFWSAVKRKCVFVSMYSFHSDSFLVSLWRPRRNYGSLSHCLHMHWHRCVTSRCAGHSLQSCRGRLLESDTCKWWRHSNGTSFLDRRPMLMCLVFSLCCVCAVSLHLEMKAPLIFFSGSS